MPKIYLCDPVMPYYWCQTLEATTFLETGVLIGWIVLDAYAYQKFWCKIQNLTEAVQGLQREIHGASPIPIEVDAS